MKKSDSELKVKSSQKLDEQVKRELEQEDPSDEQAKASINDNTKEG